MFISKQLQERVRQYKEEQRHTWTHVDNLTPFQQELLDTAFLMIDLEFDVLEGLETPPNYSPFPAEHKLRDAKNDFQRLIRRAVDMKELVPEKCNILGCRISGYHLHNTLVDRNET